MDVISLGTFTPSVLLEVARMTGRLTEAGVDVREVAVPSSPAQFASLRDGERLGPYIGTVVARMRPAKGFRAVDRLLGALRETANGIASGELDGETCAAATSVLGLAPSTAGEHLAVLRDPTRGLIPDGSVDTASLATLVALRRRFLPAPELNEVVERLDDVVRSGVLAT